MPTIALPPLQEMAPAAAPVLDRERRPTLDTGPIQQGLARLNDASKMPMQDPNAAAAPYEALGSVGRAVQRTGSIMAAAAEKERESIAIRQGGDFEVKLNEKLGELEQWMQDNSRTPEAWTGRAKTAFEELRSSLNSDKNLLPAARENITRALNLKEAQYMRELGTTAQKTNHALARDTLGVELGLAVDNQDKAKFDAIVTGSAFAERYFPHERTVWEERFATKGKQIANDAAENQFKTGIMLADESMVEKALSYGKEKAGWDSDFITAKRLSGQEGVRRTKEVNQSRSEAEFLGQMMLKKAQGEVFVPSQVESWVKENKIDKDTGARLIVALKSEQGAMQGEFYDFLNNSVDVYDPKQDPEGVKSYELQKQAAALGLNKDQYNFFMARLDRASKLNGPQRAQEAVLAAGKKVIGEMFKDTGKTRSWDADAETLLKDPVKLAAFGISAENAKAISENMAGNPGNWITAATEGNKPEALKLFRKEAATRPAVKPASLTQAEWDKLVNLSEGDVSVDPRAQMSAEFNRAFLEEGLEAWYKYELNKRGTPPDEKEVRAWVGDKTRSVLQGVNAGDLFTPADVPAQNFHTSARASGDLFGLDNSTVDLVKGFEGFTPNAYGDFKQTSVGYGTRARFEGETLTETEADARLREELTMHAKRVDALVQKHGAKLTPEQRGALVSFDFNTGAVHRLFERAGSDTTQWPAIMREFKKAGGKDLPGLISRRGKEASFFE